MSGLMSGILLPFDGLDPMLSLIPLSVLVGIGMLWIFGRTSNQEAIRRVKAQVQAHIYEMRLFGDEPALIWKAQWDLLTSNAHYMALMLAPALVASIPMVLLFAQMECFYGYEPLQTGQAAIVTMQLRDGLNGAEPALHAPAGIAVESPGVRVDGGRQISWRIRALHPITGALQFAFPGGTVEKTVQAGQGPQYVSERRVSSLLDLVWYPAEKRLPAGPVDWIEIRYPAAKVHALGIDLHWLIWLLLISMVSALLLKKRFRVAF